VARDTFEVTVKGGGDPETFVAKEVEIVVNGYERFVIRPAAMYGVEVQAPEASYLNTADGANNDEILVYETYD
jgi:hypothetical protein